MINGIVCQLQIRTASPIGDDIQGEIRTASPIGDVINFRTEPRRLSATQFTTKSESLRICPQIRIASPAGHLRFFLFSSCAMRSMRPMRAMRVD